MSSIEPAQQATDRKPGTLERTADFQSNIDQFGKYVNENSYYTEQTAVLKDEKENAQRRRYKRQPQPMGKNERQGAV